MPPGLGARALTSVAVVLAAAALVYGPQWLLTIGVLLIGAGGVTELYRMLSRTPPRLPPALGILLVGLLVLSAAGPDPRLLSPAVFLSITIPLLWVMYRGPEVGGLQLWAYGSAAALYVGWPLAHIELLRLLPGGAGWLILGFLCTWATDTGAYLVGSLMGRRKLAPSISPGKTVEGSLGALVLTGAVGALIGSLVRLPVGVAVAGLIGVALSLVAQGGDLAESCIKRLAGVKDSGSLLPGHGGLLDRIDGLLWVVVATYYLASVIR